MFFVQYISSPSKKKQSDTSLYRKKSGMLPFINNVGLGNVIKKLHISLLIMAALIVKGWTVIKNELFIPFRL